MTPFPSSFLTDIMRRALFQPATNYWRAIELTVLIEKAFPRLKDCRAIFDLGCGDGEIMRVLRPHLPMQAQLTGIDIDEAEINLAKTTGLYGQLHCTSAECVPMADATQDAIISNSVLEHIGPLEAALAESSRILKQGGWFIATVPSPDFHTCLKGSWRCGVSRAQYLKEMDERLVHLRYWSEAEWRDQLARVGIDLIQCSPYLSKTETQRWELLTRLTGGMLYYLTRGRKRPILIQRGMGVRRRMVAPKWLAAVVAWLVSFGVRQSAGHEEDHACFLIVGQKR